MISVSRGATFSLLRENSKASTVKIVGKAISRGGRMTRAMYENLKNGGL